MILLECNLWAEKNKTYYPIDDSSREEENAMTDVLASQLQTLTPQAIALTAQAVAELLEALVRKGGETIVTKSAEAIEHRMNSGKMSLKKLNRKTGGDTYRIDLSKSMANDLADKLKKGGIDFSVSYDKASGKGFISYPASSAPFVNQSVKDVYAKNGLNPDLVDNATSTRAFAASKLGSTTVENINVTSNITIIQQQPEAKAPDVRPPASRPDSAEPRRDPANRDDSAHAQKSAPSREGAKPSKKEVMNDLKARAKAKTTMNASKKSHPQTKISAPAKPLKAGR